MYQLDNILIEADSLDELADLCTTGAETAVANEAEGTIEFYNEEGALLASLQAFPVREVELGYEGACENLA